MAKKEALMAHGMTARMYEELKLRKLSDDVEMIPANLADKLQDKLFQKDFAGHEIPQHERFHYHVAQELRLFSQTTGARQSEPSIHVYDKAMWELMKGSDTFKSYTSELIHNPELEKKDAPLITLKYTLTDEEAKALEGGEEEEETEDETINPKTLTLEQVEAITDVKIAKAHVKALGGKPTKSMTLEAAKAKIIELLELA